MNKAPAVLVLIASALIIDINFTNLVLPMGDAFVRFSSHLAALSLAVSVVFGFVVPALIRKAELRARLLDVIIEENTLTVNGVRSTAMFSADGELISQLELFEQTLRDAVNAALSPSRFTIKPSANVTVLPGSCLELFWRDKLRLDHVLDDMFIKVDMRIGSFLTPNGH